MRMILRSLPLLAMSALVLAACGSNESSPGDGPKVGSERTVKASTPTPIGCLERAGLEDAEQRDEDLWRAHIPGDALLVRIERMASNAEARQAVEAATGVQASQAGPYAVFGGLKEADGGENVRLVAACLGAN